MALTGLQIYGQSDILSAILSSKKQQTSKEFKIENPKAEAIRQSHIYKVKSRLNNRLVPSERT